MFKVAVDEGNFAKAQLIVEQLREAETCKCGFLVVALSEIGDGYKELFIHYYFLGVSPEEVNEVLGF